MNGVQHIRLYIPTKLYKAATKCMTNTFFNYEEAAVDERQRIKFENNWEFDDDNVLILRDLVHVKDDNAHAPKNNTVYSL